MNIPTLPSRKRIKPIAICSCGLLLAGLPLSAVEYPTRTKGSTKVRIYEQRPMPETNGGAKGGPGHVIAKYSDLIQKAIAYKQQHPTEAVEIRYATYKLSKFVYIGFNPAASSTYLGVSNTDFAGADSEKLMWSLRKAAQAGVKVKVLFQLPGESGVPLSELTDYFDAETSSNFEYKVVAWPTGGVMHNKFLLINKTRAASGSEFDSIVYTVSANVDEWKEWGPASSKNWQQTGVLLYQNSGVYNAYKKYFDQALWPHAEDTTLTNFQNTINALHAGNGLNYPEDSNGISAYFYPFPGSSFWSTTYNPHAKLFNTINNNGNVSDPVLKMNQSEVNFHHASWTEFGELWMDGVNEMATVHSIDLSDTGVAAVRIVDRTNDDDGNDYAPIASNRLSLGQPTHSKNNMYTYDLSGTQYYYSLGGSTNAKRAAFARANNIIMIKEVGTANREVYQDFYDVFQYIFHY